MREPEVGLALGRKLAEGLGLEMLFGASRICYSEGGK
jgi:hypothetical protein